MNYGEGGTPASSSVSVRQRDPDVIRECHVSLITGRIGS